MDSLKDIVIKLLGLQVHINVIFLEMLYSPAGRDVRNYRKAKDMIRKQEEAVADLTHKEKELDTGDPA